MKCEFNYENLLGCGAAQGGITLATAIAGAVAAPFALTAATVSTVALTAGLFAAPAALFGLVTTGLFASSKDLRTWAKENPIEYLGINASVFALLSTATIVAGVMFGLLTTPLMIVFIVAAVIGTTLQIAPFFLLSK